MRHWKRGTAHRVLLVILAAMMLVSMQPVAALGATGSLSGTVTGGGLPLEGVVVTVMTSSRAVVGTATTQADGSFTVLGLEPTGYYVHFDASAYNTANGTHYASEYISNDSTLGSANPVWVVSGGNVTGVDAVLEVMSIGGTVTLGSTPVGGIPVNVLTPGGSLVASLETWTDGSYSVAGLADGTYVVHVNPSAYNLSHGTTYVAEYYDDAFGIASATLIDVADGVPAAGKDISLQVGGSVGGTVSGTGGPLSGVLVRVYRASDHAQVGSATTGADGKWQVGGLASGEYLAYFESGWVREYYNDVFTLDEAHAVSVTIGAATTGVNALLEFQGNVSGTVTAGATPLGGLTVQARNLYTDAVIASTTTDSSGGYTLTGLPVNMYHIYFDATAYNASNDTWYISEYYDDALQFGTAESVRIFGGHTIGGLDADLAVGGSITGAVTWGGTARSDVQVIATDALTGAMLKVVKPAADGNYVLGPLSAGQYEVEFRPDYPSLGLVGEYFNNVHSEAAASAVSVTQGAATPGISADLEYNTLLGGTILGDGQPLVGVDVYVFELGKTDAVATAVTGADGTYAVRYLIPDKWYEVVADPESYNDAHGTEFEPRYYGDALPSEEPVPVKVVLGSTSTQNLVINLAALSTCISGRVTTPQGAPLEGIDVYAWSQGFLRGYAVTDASGDYTIEGLWADTYAVEFDPEYYNEINSTAFIGEYYNGAGYVESEIDWVTLTHGVTAGNVNATLDAPAPAAPTPVYRFYNTRTGTHFYTADPAEMQRVRDTMSNVYTFEGVGYTINTANPANSAPLYRFYNKKTGTHLYTADEGEKNTILGTLSATYSLDGVAYNVSMTSGTQVHRFFSPSKGVHFYSSDPTEIANVRANLGHIWQYEGPAYYVGQ